MITEGGFYYLHTNGDLIWKRFRPEYDSDFVKRVWAVDAADGLCLDNRRGSPCFRGKQNSH